MRDKSRVKMMSQITAFSSIGTLIEWYDFFIIASAAATVWPSIFYPKSSSPAAAVAASIATYASAYFSRPVGALVFGHYGDKIGRKSMLVLTLLVTAVGMIGVAVVPPYAAVGLLAPILVLVFRLIEGIGLGGEWGGASSIIMEHAAEGGRVGYWTSWMQSTTAFGIVLSIIATLLLREFTSPAYFIDYGWRILVGAGAAALVVGGIMRLYVLESPLFKDLLQRGNVERRPISTAFRSDWTKLILAGLMWPFVVTLVAIEAYPTGLSYMVAKGLQLNSAYLAIIAGNLVQAAAIITGGVLGDRVNRMRLLLLSNGISLITASAFFPLINAFALGGAMIAYVLLGFSIGLGFGNVAALLTELFPTRYRYTASGFSFQLGGVIAGIYASLLLPLVIVESKGITHAWPSITYLAVSVCVISLVANLILGRLRK